MRKLELILFPKINIILKLLFSTQKRHFSVNFNGRTTKHQSYMHLFQDPSKIQSLNDAKSLHALVIKMCSIPRQEPVFLHNNIISKYALLGDIFMARKLFDEMPQRNIVSYNSMIGSYCRYGFLEEAWELLSEMRKCDLEPTQFTFGSILSCSELDVLQGIQLQALIEKNGLLYADPFSGTALLGMYGRHECLDEAVGLFEYMPNKNLVTWNSMISIFGQMGFIEDCIFMFSELMRSQMGVSDYTFVSVLSGLEEVHMLLGEQIHGLAIKYGFDNVASVSNCMIYMYANFDLIRLAEKVFEKAWTKDIISWNTLIGTMATSNRPNKALDLFMKMSIMGLKPNETTLLNVLNSCSRLRVLLYGEWIHAKMIKKRFESDVYNGSALVNFYAKCDKVQEANLCFNEITGKNLVSWNSLILGYSNTGSPLSVKIFQEMIRSGFYPNEVSFSTVLKSSLQTELLQLHSLTIKMGYHENDYVLSSLISSYARNDLVSDALVFPDSDSATLGVVSSNINAWICNQTGQYDRTLELYAAMENPDSISWNILIAACSRSGDYKETFELFDHMRRSRVYPDNYTYVSLFSVCTRLCNLALGTSLHGLLIKNDFNLCDTFVCNIMIDMYGKCGSLESCVKIFDEVKDKNVISWTALVSALGLHGYANEALETFGEMERRGFEPDNVAFLSVLSACRHVGLVKEGMELFSEMKSRYGIEPEIYHYMVVVDLLARFGHLKEAEKLILGMPIPPNALIWRSFLEGCKKQRNIEALALAA